VGKDWNFCNHACEGLAFNTASAIHKYLHALLLHSNAVLAKDKLPWLLLAAFFKRSKTV